VLAENAIDPISDLLGPLNPDRDVRITEQSNVIVSPNTVRPIMRYDLISRLV
jgi:hypothetical protein